MAVPASYTDEELRIFMITVLGRVATVIGWTKDTGQIAEAVNDTLIAYGVDDISEATDVEKLRALARHYAWSAAVDWLSTDFNFSADGGRYDRAQVFEHAQQRLDAAWSEAFQYLPRYSIQAHTTSYTVDPYINDPDLEDSSDG